MLDYLPVHLVCANEASDFEDVEWSLVLKHEFLFSAEDLWNATSSLRNRPLWLRPGKRRISL